MTFYVCFQYLALCRALAEYLSVLLFMIKACRVTDLGAERQLSNGFRLRQMQEKACLRVVIALTLSAPSWILLCPHKWCSGVSEHPSDDKFHSEQWWERPGIGQPLSWHARVSSAGQESSTFSWGVAQPRRGLSPELTLGSVLVTLARKINRGSTAQAHG